MLLRRLELIDFRSYRRAAVDLGPGVTILVGPNAHGKTNFVEAAYRLATGSSHRISSDAPLIRHGTESGYVRAVLETDEGRRRALDLELRAGRGARLRVEGQEIRRGEAAGFLRVVLFAPEDLLIIRGDPAERRRFLDDLLAQRRPSFAAARAEYERVLRQRNRLLKTLRGSSEGMRPREGSTLEVWTEHLVQHGARLVAARMAAVDALAAPAADFYRQVADREEPLQLAYRCSAGFTTVARPTRPGQVASDPAPAPPADLAALAAVMREAVAQVAEEERQRAMTLVGPHRDDLELTLDGLPARGYASHGQLWSLALSLRLASYEVLAEVGDRPVVLLDDVFAVLDEPRRARLGAACAGWEQVIVTSAVERDAPLEGEWVDVRMEDDGSHVLPRGHSAVA